MMRLNSEIAMSISTTPTYEKKDSYLEQPIEHIHRNDNPPSIFVTRETEKENNNSEVERIDLNDQEQAEYEARVKRAE